MSRASLTDDAAVVGMIRKCVDDRDGAAWELFVRTYSGLIWSTIHRTFSLYAFRYAKEDSEDLYSSVFFSLLEDDFRRLRQFRSETACSFSTWLKVITSRMTIDHIRRDRNGVLVGSDEEGRDIFDAIPEERPSPSAALEKKQENDHFEKALVLLSPDDRHIYDLIYTRDVPPEEIARALGVSVATVYSKKNRIMKKIKKSIKDMQENGSSTVL